MSGSLVGCGGRQESGMGPQACPLGGQTGATGPAPPPHPAACRPTHPRSPAVDKGSVNCYLLSPPPETRPGPQTLRGSQAHLTHTSRG